MSKKNQLTLVLGHAASGKSLWAEEKCSEGDREKVYVATARSWDAEVRAKIDRHVERRGAAWTTIEEETDLAAVCRGRPAGQIVLIDCATMWLTNLMMDDAAWQPLAEDWIVAMTASPADFVIVSNDVGGGVTPDNAMARRFQTMQGTLNQQLARACDRVVLVTAGLAQTLK